MTTKTASVMMKRSLLLSFVCVIVFGLITLTRESHARSFPPIDARDARALAIEQNIREMAADAAAALQVDRRDENDENHADRDYDDYINNENNNEENDKVAPPAAKMPTYKKGIVIPIAGHRINICDVRFLQMAQLTHEKILEILMAACSGASGGSWLVSKVAKYVFNKNLDV